MLSEKQDSQESDLAALKNELRALREQQNKDKDLILQLQTMASDNGWGIANLKAAQDQVMLSLSLESVSGRCCLNGSCIHRPIFCCSSHSPDTCPHPVLHIPRSLWPFFGRSLLISPVFGVFLYVRTKSIFAF